MTIEVPAEKVSSAIQQRLHNMSRQVKISGFRPGKVPMNVVKQRYGKQSVFKRWLQIRLQSSYQEAIHQEKLRPAGSPQIEPLNVEAEQDLKYVATFEVYPEIKLADVSTFEVEVADVEIVDKDFDDIIEKLRKQKVQWSEVDRAAKNDDQVTIDFKGSMDGELFPGGSSENFPTVLGSGNMIPDFEKQLEGVKKGEEKTFDVTFPEDYMQKDLAGKVASFEIKVQKVDAGELPEIDEEFIKGLGVEDGKLESLKNQLKESMEAELSQRKKAFDKGNVMQCLLDNNEFVVPHSLVHSEIHALKHQSMSEMNLKDESKLPDSLFEEEAKRRISLGLMIGEIVQQNKIELDSEKVTEHINMIAVSYGKPAEVTQYYRSNPQAMAGIESLVMEEQVIEWILGQAKQISKTFTFDEFVNKQVLKLTR